jgi:3-oxoacyl-[acyl-carrier protein] reductase
MRLKNKNAIVTGGASGFGAEIARVFAREGASVLVVDRNEEGASAVASEIGGLAKYCDVTSRADIDDAVAFAIDHFGQIDLVVNNAGWCYPNKPMLDTTEEEFDRVYNVNVKSIYHVAQSIVPHMRQRRSGAIINIGSTGGIRPRPGLTWYNGSKGAVNMLSRSMAVELAPDNIRVNCVAPVIGATALLENFMGMPDTVENRAKFIASIPLGRLTEPSDVAGACLYLASDEASFVTGVVLEVDGGRTI